MVGNYHADFYVINGMVLETRKRREHLSSDDLKKNKALLENFAKGNAEYLEQQNGKFILFSQFKDLCWPMAPTNLAPLRVVKEKFISNVMVLVGRDGKFYK